jgi:L-histidine N-alpha-methyltransferase
MHGAAAPAAERESEMLREVRSGLLRSPKELPSKYFYDHRGSLLFEEITKLPEYYLTRAERRVLRQWMPSLMREIRPVALVELGAGSGEKTRIILRAMHAAGSGRTYIPIDVSAAFLDDSAARMRAELPWLAVEPRIADFTREIAVGPHPDGVALFAFLGSTIGNLDTPNAITLLRAVRFAMRPSDRFLLGADLHTKPVERIERAYNDSIGITAEFNLNMLRVLNQELGCNFDPARFRHRASWSWPHHRIEMHLDVLESHTVNVPGLGAVGFRAGESIRTELCTKYDRAQLERMLDAAGLAIERWHVDAHDQYAILVAAPVAQT